ncbi:hypothetical protein CVT26_013663 [Gymnopilus dilepis]|uniref:Uncharacterized protein n=1 Tax=Gymnopilus dilepis TaxID=231916 RepID=A0A409YWE6_9AGAR|nr:hypothetical protein CVT26_013663 [Gymnopilus dilepis]
MLPKNGNPAGPGGDGRLLRRMKVSDKKGGDQAEELGFKFEFLKPTAPWGNTAPFVSYLPSW